MDSIRVFFLFLLVIISPISVAEASEELYSSEQLVSRQFGEPSLKQVRQGLQDVLVKVAGNRDVLSKPVILEQTRSAKRMLQQFGYRAAQQAIEPDGQAKVAYILRLDFDSRAVDQMLEAAGERPLGALRPSLVVWLAAQQRGQRDYVSPDGYIYDKVKAAAAKRGLPLRLPLLDLSDQRALPVSDLWGLFDSSIQDASARYRADAVLAGRMIQTSSGNWLYEWLLLQGGKPERFSGNGSLNSEIPEVMDQTADKLFAALKGSGFSYRLEGLAVRISSVNTLSDYIDIVDYMKSITAVTAVHTVMMQENTLELMVELDGNLEQFEHALGLQPQLVPTESVGQDLTGLTLNYRWLR
jgi:hypothetical protein